MEGAMRVFCCTGRTLSLTGSNRFLYALSRDSRENSRLHEERVGIPVRRPGQTRRSHAHDPALTPTRIRPCRAASVVREAPPAFKRSEAHTSELQSLMRISYAVFCLKKKIIKHST